SVPVLGYSHYSSVRPVVERHTHPGCVEISLCVRGSLTFECEDQEYTLMPSEMLVVQPSTHHRLITNPKGMILYWLFFRLELDKDTLLKLPKAESVLLRRKLTSVPLQVFSTSPQMQNSFNHLFSVYDETKSGSFRTLIMRTSVLALLLATIESSRNVEGRPKYDGMLEAIERIKINPEIDYNLDELARDVSLSRSLFNTRFKQLTGFPPYAFILSCKMQKAKQLLSRDDISVTDVAYELGFSSSQHFAMHFKREFGMTPSEWKKV
ncbi:MAG: helix-turn-helix domain-containing protein, partial [Kiritimatiellia bacterium]